MNKLKINLLGLLAAAVICFGWAQSAHADVNDFVINRFDAEYSLTRSDPQGTLAVTELIDVTFTDQNHGILRALPNSYKSHRLQLHVDQVSAETASAQWSTYQSNGNTVIKIGDPNHTVTGRNRYSIQYTVNNVIGFYPDHDELFWDVNGDQWSQTTLKVSSILHLPEGLKLSNNKPICYAGSFSSASHDCTIVYDKTASSVIAKATKPLQSNQTLSIVVGFSKGYFKPSSWLESVGEYSSNIIGFSLPVLLLGGIAGLFWCRRGRDAKGRGVIVPQYDAPDKMLPLEVGTIVDFKTENRDITATIIDLAIRGYIKIIETTKPRKLLKDLTVYSLQLKKDDFIGLKDFESKILKSIFDGKPVGTEISLDDLKFKLASTATSLHSSTKQSLQTRGYIRKITLGSSLRFILVLILAYLISIMFALIYKAPAVVGILAGTVFVGIFLALLPSRTAKGTAAKEHAQGLKMYLEVAEKDRIKMLQSPSAPYAAKSSEPKHTVDLFEKLLPYAMVLGVEKQWATKFENIYKTAPDWYSGNWQTFNAVYLASSINSGVGTAVNTAFSSPASSSGSGFSGGGAGGGGGGGGGGGW